jgi:uncharacterized protein YhaN
MQIRHMTATFGRLEQAELTLQPGLNVIYAPNESGKSTWSRFIRNMLYGLSTHDRGLSADKNRYAPWSGAAMRGRMELTADGADYTLLRETQRANAPMGAFSCTYTGTATPVPGITRENAGEQFLGVSREVFERSAFIGQAALAVEQSSELERRIAALITTGEEDTSYSDTYDRLKKQLNRRKHNKTGQIPALEREIAGLDDTLAQLEELQAQHRSAGQQVKLSETHLQELQAQQEQWAHWELAEKRQQYREAVRTAEKAQDRADTMAELAGTLPDDGTLARLESRHTALLRGEQELNRAQRDAEEVSAGKAAADDAYRAHPLYPADEAGLQDRLRNMTAPEPSGPLPFRLSIIAAVCAAAAAVLSLILRWTPWITAVTACLCFLCTVLAIRQRRTHSRILRQQEEMAQARDAFSRQIKAYLPLRQAAADTSDAEAKAKGLCDVLRQRQQEDLRSFLSELSVFRSAADLSAAGQALNELRRQRDALAEARQTAQNEALRRDLLAQSLPSGSSDAGEPAQRPTMSRAQLQALLPQVTSNLHATRSRLDTLTGQIRSLGDPDDLLSRRAQKTEQLTGLQAEYDAIAMAMDALNTAHLTLQNRFSPALGARAAEIFSAITGGRYQGVLLSRDFSLSAEPTGDASQRSIQLLSQGAADQLYLSVRLAICDMVLPRDKAVPLILDDALVSFDDERLHAALDYLLRESETRQILLFTCQTREQTYLAGRENVSLLTL